MSSESHCSICGTEIIQGSCQNPDCKNCSCVWSNSSTTVRVQVSNVKWDFSDTPGKKPKLPTDFILELNVDADYTNEDDIEADVSNAISDTHGYCHYGFSFYIIKPMIQQAGD